MAFYEEEEGQEQDHSISDFVKAETEKGNQENGLLRVNAKAAQEIPQDKAARVLEMRARTKLDSGIIERNLEEIEKDDALGFDWDMFRKTSPRLAQWYMESPDHIAVVKPVLGQAQDLERIFYRKDDTSRPLSVEEMTAEATRSAQKKRAIFTAQEEQLNSPFFGASKDQEGKASEELGKLKPPAPDPAVLQEELERIQAREAYISKSYKIGAGEAVARIFEDNPLTLLPFAKDIPDTGKAIQIKAATNAIQAGSATPEQEDLVRAYGRLAMAAERRGTDLWGHVAELVVHLPATAGEFALTGGAYTAGRVAVENGLRVAVRQVLSGTAAKIARKVPGVMAGAATQMAVMSPVMVAQDTVRRWTPNVEITADKAGELGVALSDGDSGGTAFLKALGHNYIQTLSERTGIIPEKLVAPLKRIAFGRWMQKNPSGTVGKFLEKVADKTGWNGVLGEVFEERAAELMEAGAGIEKYKLPSAEQVGAEFLAFSVPGAASEVTKKAASFVTPKQKQGAERTAQTVKELTAAVQEMGLNEKHPQVAEAIVERLAGDAKEAHIPVEVWNTFHQSQKDENGAQLSPRQVFAEVVGNTESYDEAMRTQGKVVVPTKTYLTSPTLEAGRQFFEDHVVFDPLQMSKQETKDIVAQEQAKAQEATLAEQAKAEVEARDVERQAVVQKAKESVDKVNDAVRQGLEASGFKKEASAYGTVVSRVFKTLGERENVDPYELFSERPLTIERQGDLPVDDQGQVYNQPAGADVPGDVGKPHRGVIKIGKASIKIGLLKDADSSTFLHETGHLYLELLSGLAAKPTASPQIKVDLETVRSWLGVKEGQEIAEPQHERWARAFEKYLLEGQAPSKALRGAFFRLKQWLSDVYQGMKEALGFDLNEDIRRVMDRLLATDEEIAEAQAEQAQVPLFEDAKKAGATDAQAERYAKLTVKARETAEAKLLEKAMRQARREREQWWKDERKKARSKVESEVNQEPVYRALSVLQTGKLPDGSELPTSTFAPGIKEIKIDRKSIAPLFGGQYADIDLRMFPKGITAPEGGLHPDIVAGMFGFETGRELMVALQGMEDRKDKIDRVTDERMHAEFGAEPTEEEIKDAALASIHSDDRAEQIQLEMEILARNDKGLLKLIAGGVIPQMDVLRRDAGRAIGQTKLRNINPKQYLANERKAARNALNAYLNGKVKEALYEKRMELVNHESFRVADKAKEDFTEFLEFVRPIIKSSERYDEKLGKSMDMDYVNAARAVLARVNIGKSDKSASDWLAPIKQYDPQKYDDMIGMVNAAVPEANREIADLTYEEFKALKEAVEALWDGASSSRHVEIRGKRLTIDEAKGPLIARMDEIEPVQKPKRAKTDSEKSTAKLLGAIAAASRVEHWASGLGQKFMEAFPQNIHEGTDAYGDWVSAQMKEYEEKLKKLPAIKRGEIHSHELDFTFSGKGQLIGALLHMGNAEDGASNMWKFLLGWEFAKLKEDGSGIDATKWSEFIARMQEKGILTEEDYDFVQSIWDQFEKIKPEVQKAHRKLRNVYFAEITATPFYAFGKQYRGGYYPALADPAEEAAAAVRGEKAEAEVGNSFAVPTAGSGATKHRSKTYWKKLRMDLNAIPEHLKWAGRYIHIEPKVADLRRLMWDKEFRERLDKFNPQAAGEMLMPWLQRTAMQKVEAPMKSAALRAGSKWLRGVAGAKQIGLNFINAAQNYEGLVVALTKVPAQHLGPAFKQVTLHPHDTHAIITSKSAYMRNVSQEVVGSLSDTADEILHDPSPIQNFRQWAKKNIYFMSKFTQAHVSNTVWLGSYNDAYAKNPAIEDDDAVRHADSVVRTTQGSSAPEDISAYEAGTAFTRLFTMYQSWFNMRSNLLASEAVRIRRETGLPNKKARYLHLATMGFLMPALVGMAIKKALKNEPLDKDNDGYLDDLMRFFFGAVYQEGKAMVPIGGPLVDLLEKKADKNPMNDHVNVSPAFAAVEQLADAVLTDTEDIKKRPGKAVEDALMLFNVITGIPTAAVSQEAGYVTDVLTGNKKPSGAFDAVRGALTGSGPKK